ncbi:hypothetical protein LCGC14_0870870 [marine sediment metagenome]|uniref:Uncharacterized protein n=1 Tax=marine sediment metagenome TaxID=412755 RepID=A0A0F9SBS9_9ZZZZ
MEAGQSRADMVHVFGKDRSKDLKESNPYGIPTTNANIQAPLASLNVLYERMPKTAGCEQCQQQNGKDSFWCCQIICPSMYYVEFLNVWAEVQKWNMKKRLPIILRAIKTYLSNKDSKGCIFYDNKCLVYNQRPINCRFYGVISQSSWDKRTTALKERYKDQELSEDFQRKLTQCDLVSNDDGTECIPEDTEQRWFEHTTGCEARIGINPLTILEHDSPKGSYRTFHDHIMLEFVDTVALSQLTKIKMSLPTEEDINAFADALFEKTKENLK